MLSDNLKSYLAQEIARRIGSQIDFCYEDKPSPIRKKGCKLLVKINGNNRRSGAKVVNFAGYQLPVVFWYGEEPWIRIEAERMITNIDIPYTFAAFLQAIPRDRSERCDKFGRVPDNESFSFKKGFRNIPILDIYSKFLRNVLFGGAQRDEHLPAFFLLTHDVDRLHSRYSLRHGAMRALRGDLKPVALNIADRFLSRVSKTVGQLLALEREKDFFSIFFLMVRKGDLLVPNADYSPQDLKRLPLRSFLIGLHPSLGAGFSLEKLEHEKTVLEEVCGTRVEACRMHYLAYRFPDTFNYLQHLGVMVDSSVGFTSTYGYRSGTAFPYKVFDPHQNVEFQIMEIPPLWMDVVFSEADEALNALERLVMNTKRYGGVLTIIFHNHSLLMNFGRLNGMQLYKQMLEILHESGLKDLSKEVRKGGWKVLTQIFKGGRLGENTLS